MSARAALAAALLGTLAGCSPPCEVICTRLAECNALPAGDVEACAADCADARPAGEDRAACARCVDRVACLDLPACQGDCPLELVPAPPEGLGGFGGFTP